LALVWEGSEPHGGEQKLLIALDGNVGIGCCEGLFMPLQFMEHKEAIWTDIQAHFAPFQYEMEDEKLIFKGRGEIASPAWQRAIATWSRTTWGEFYTGGACASCNTVLMWRHEEWQAAEQTKYCATLIVTDIGRVSISSLVPCDSDKSDLPTTERQHTWLTTNEWEQFDTWLYGRDSVDFQNGQFSGRGSQPMSEDELLELSTWEESVYSRLTSDTLN
jgi:hypothetical protein